MVAVVKRFNMQKIVDTLPSTARIISLAVLLGVIILLITSFIKRGSQKPIPPPKRGESRLNEQVVAIMEGYRYVSNENGREKYRLLAARDTSYADGRHELEQIDLVARDKDGKEATEIKSDRGVYQPDQGKVTFTGNVRVTGTDGLEAASEALTYDEQNEMASTDVAVSFKRKEISGQSVGAQLNLKSGALSLIKEAKVTFTPEVAKGKDPGGPPLVIQSGKADFSRTDGLLKFVDSVTAIRGQETGKSDQVTGFLEPKTHKLERVEMRGHSYLKSEEPGKMSELQAQDIDFIFNPDQRLTTSVASGGVNARSLEKDSPREMTSEKVTAIYTPTKDGSELQSLTSDSRTMLKIASNGVPGKSKPPTERVLEADHVSINFRPGGKLLQHGEAAGNALLTVTPTVITPEAERKRLRAPRFVADFYEGENAIKTFVGDGGAVAEIEPMDAKSTRTKRVLSARKMTAQFDQPVQEVTQLVAEDDVKLTNGVRHASGAKAVYASGPQMVALRGNPVVWDDRGRTNADEIDTYLDAGRSDARGHVRTTYYKPAVDDGSTPFKKRDSPFFVAADRAVVKHDEGTARFNGNARAWQEDDFVRAEMIEFDRGERQMLAEGGVQSALYGVERQVEEGKKEVVPVFGAADRMRYTDQKKEVRYESKVKLKQGTDEIDAAEANVYLDEDNRLSRMIATGTVVLTQPGRRGTGNKVDYTADSDSAILTGNPAQVDDRDHETTTKSTRLTLHLRDARIEASDEGGTKRVRTTHRIQR